MSCFAAVYILTVPSVLTRGDIGLIWSARHFMLLMPILVILSAKSLKHIMPADIKYAEILPLGVALFAVCQQIAGIYSLYTISNEARSLENTVREFKTPVIASDVFYLPEMTPRLWFENIMLDISTAQKANAVSNLHPKEMLLILSNAPQFRRISNTDLAKLMQNYVPASGVVRFKKSAGTGFIDLMLLKVRHKGAVR